MRPPFLSAVTGFCLFLLAATSCKPSSSESRSPASVGKGGPVLVSWTANREVEVNQAGGGYRVYYSQTSGAALGSTSYVDVPFNGTSTPTSVTTPSLPAGVNYIRVVAYTAAKPTGSAPSSQFTVNVP